MGLRGSGGLLVLDAATGVRRRIIASDGTALNDFGKWSLSPDGGTLAALGLQHDYHDIAMQLFDATTREARMRIPVETEHPPLAMAWSSDGQRLALVSSSWLSIVVTIWDASTGRLLLTLKRKGLLRGKERAIRFSPDNHRLLHIADNQIELGALENPSLHPIHIWDATPLQDDRRPPSANHQ